MRTGAGRGWTQEDTTAAELAHDLMRNGGTAERNRLEMLAGRVSGLADGFGHLIGLAETDADFALAITHNEERAEAETTTALDDPWAHRLMKTTFSRRSDLFSSRGPRGPRLPPGAATATTTALTAATTALFRRAFDRSSHRFGCVGQSRLHDGIGYDGLFGYFLFNDVVGLWRHRCND